MTARQIHHGSLFCFMCVVFFLYGSNLAGFWRSDDTAILAHAITHSPLSNFADPAIWQQLSPSNLTPLLPLSFRIDHLLAGLHPALFYLHQLLVVVAIGWLAFLWLQKSIHPAIAACAMLLFLLGLPIALTVSQLMTRHYLEGLLGALVALHAVHRLNAGWSRRWLSIFAAGFLLAITAKEIYVPLGLALAMEALWRRLSGQPRLSTAAPLAVAGLLTVIYVLWRQWMLPDLIGGYGDNSRLLEPAYWQQILQSFAGFPKLLFGDYAAIALLPCVILPGIQLALQPRQSVSLLIWSGAILLPLLPLVVTPGILAADRYLLLPWFGLCCLVAFAADSLLKHARSLLTATQGATLAAIPLAVLLACTAVRLQEFRPELAQGMARSDTMLRFVWESSDATSFVPDPGMAAAYWTVQYAAVLKQLSDPAATVPLMVSDDLLLDAGKPLFAYDPSCHCMQDISASIPQRLATLETAHDRDAALHIEMRNDAGVLGWTFGPHAVGRYLVVSRDVGKRTLPAYQAGLRSTIDKPVQLQIKYESPDGWFTTTPLLELRADGSPLYWSREDR